ncbi:MAG: response regulator [Acidobacteria bacterium]|nr:response regulator [Acidobacteriota bacterium]
MSVLIAVFASYTALDLAHRVNVARGRARSVWLAVGSFVMGLGIWSMHFVAMLAFSLPRTPIAYNIPLLILSMAVAILASLIALFVVSRRDRPAPRVLAAGLAMGIAISGMHYIGIASMRLSARIHWNVSLVVASIAIAIGAAFAALWLSFRWRKNTGVRTVVNRLIGGTVMGFAISGMHYTAMAAMSFTLDPQIGGVSSEHLLASSGLAVAVIGATGIILSIALVGSIVQRELDRRADLVEEMERLFHHSERRAAEEEALRRVTESIVSALTVDEVLRQIAGEAVEATRAESAVVERIVTPNEEIMIAAAAGDLSNLIGRRVPYEGSVSQRVQGRRDMLSLDELVELPWLGEKHGHFSIIAVPLEVDSEAVGVLVLLRVRDQSPFHADEVARAAIFSHLSALAFRRIHLLEEADRRRDQLEQAERLAGLGRVASTIAHEFNNILMAIQGVNESTRRIGTIEQYQKSATQIDRAIQRGKAVTDAVLRLTRAERPDRKAVRVCSWLDTLREDLESILPGGIDVQIDCSDRSLFMLADVNHLTQAVVNLALNSRDAMSDGGTLSISASRAGADDLVSLIVADTGAGMSPDVQRRIFEPLYTTQKAGTGLGLAITHEIIRSHGGSIMVESAPGKGSTFHILLERTTPPPVTGEHPQERETGTVRRVLLVEDDDAVAEGLTIMLELEGLEVKRIALGGETVPAVEAFRPHVVVLDVGLPDMDGHDVYRALESRWPRLPIVFATGHASQTEIEQNIRRPDVQFLRKPFDTPTLMNAIQAVTREMEA